MLLLCILAGSIDRIDRRAVGAFKIATGAQSAVLCW